MLSPVALERLQALALFWVPQNDLVVNRTIIIIIIIITPSAREKLAVKTPGDCQHQIAVALVAQNFRSCLCADQMDAPI